MLKVIDYILSGALMSGVVLYMLSKLSGNKLDFKSQRTQIVFIILGIVQFLNYYFVNGFVKVFLIAMVMSLCYYVLLSKNIKEAIVVTCILDILTMISEFVFSGAMILIFGVNFSQIISNYVGSGIFIFNFIICFISVAFSQLKFVQNLSLKIISWTNKLDDKFIIVLMMLILITINIVYGSTYYKMNTVYLLLTNIILMLIYVYIVIKIINEKDRYICITSKYNVTISSLHELCDVVSILQMKGHENRNQLKTIRDMIKKKDRKVIEYIDILLGDKLKEDEKLRVETSIIANSEISSLVYSKMITMKDKGINASLHVDKALGKLNLYGLDDIMTLYICKIIGVWLDNAIEAVSKLNTKNIEMHLYVDLDNDLNISISNNYDEEVDLKKINDEGYTTKGINHGYGLSLVKDIVEKNKKFSVNTKFINNIFMQNLKVKM